MPHDVALISTIAAGLAFSLLGGFVAAEMVTMSQERVSRLVLVGAPGHQPRQGEILDQMMVDFHEYVMAGFRDEDSFRNAFGDDARKQFKELWDYSREMTARLTWKPYMFNPRLPHFLPRVTTRTLIVWGREDRIVPVVCGEQYARHLPNARLAVLERCGHLPPIERPDDFSRLVLEFLA